MRWVDEHYGSYHANAVAPSHAPLVQYHNFQSHSIHHRMIQHKSISRKHFQFFLLPIFKAQNNNFQIRKRKGKQNGIKIYTSREAFCRLDCEQLNVNASFHTGLHGSPDFPKLLFFFFIRFPFTIKYIYLSLEKSFKSITINCHRMLLFTLNLRNHNYLNVWILMGFQILCFHYNNGQTFGLR